VFAAFGTLIRDILTGCDGATYHRSSAGSTGFSSSTSSHSVLSAGGSAYSHDDSANTGRAIDASRGIVAVEVEVDIEGQENHG